MAHHPTLKIPDNLPQTQDMPSELLPERPRKVRHLLDKHLKYLRTLVNRYGSVIDVHSQARLHTQRSKGVTLFFCSNALIALARSLCKCLLAVLITASEADAVTGFLVRGASQYDTIPRREKKNTATKPTQASNKTTKKQHKKAQKHHKNQNITSPIPSQEEGAWTREGPKVVE